MQPLSPDLSRRLANMSFVCALLVVVIHLAHVPPTVGTASGCVFYFFKNVLAIAAVPFFFLVSGYFLARRAGEAGWWRRAVGRRLVTLGVPFLVWCLVPFVLFTLVWPGCGTDGECPRIALRASSVAAAFGCHLLTLPEVNRPLWYVRALFFLVLVSPAIVWAVRRFAWRAVAVFGVLYWTLNPGLCDSPDFWLDVRAQVFWKFVFSVEGLFYFSAGVCQALHPLALRRATLRRLGGLGLALGLAGLAVKRLGGTDFGYLASASIPFTLGLLWSLVPARAWPKALVGGSFALYVIHPIVLKALNEAHALPAGAGGAVLEWGLAVALSLAFAALLRRLSPRAAAFVFGGR